MDLAKRIVAEAEQIAAQAAPVAEARPLTAGEITAEPAGEGEGLTGAGLVSVLMLVLPASTGALIEIATRVGHDNLTVTQGVLCLLAAWILVPAAVIGIITGARSLLHTLIPHPLR